MKGKTIGARQNGFSILEMVVVVAVMLVLLSITVNWVMNLAQDGRRAQESDQLARELNLIGKATKEYLATAPAATYPLNTTVALPVATLVTAGVLPTDFAARGGSGTAAISPFGQPYGVVVRRTEAGAPPTAVVFESNVPLSAKLAKVGVEDSDAGLLALKQDVAGQSAQSYKTIAAAITKGTRQAVGVGNSWTKDLTAYFTGNFQASSAAALVNFPDLEPGGGDGDGGNPIASEPTYSQCRVVQGVLGSGHYTDFSTVCFGSNPGAGPPWTNEVVADNPVDVCAPTGSAGIAVLPFGGTLTTGWNDDNMHYLTTQGSCPTDWDAAANRCKRPVGFEYGVITMNSVSVDKRQCRYTGYVSGVFTQVNTEAAKFNVCCRVTPGS